MLNKTGSSAESVGPLRSNGRPAPRTPDFQGIPPVSDGPCMSAQGSVRSRCLEKRSRALRGRNLARDIQADGVSDPGSPMVSAVALFCVIGHRSHA